MCLYLWSDIISITCNKFYSYYARLIDLLRKEKDCYKCNNFSLILQYYLYLIQLNNKGFKLGIF